MSIGDVSPLRSGSTAWKSGHLSLGLALLEGQQEGSRPLFGASGQASRQGRPCAPPLSLPLPVVEGSGRVSPPCWGPFFYRQPGYSGVVVLTVKTTIEQVALVA